MKESRLKSLLLKIPEVSILKYLKRETINLFFNIDPIRFQRTLNVCYLERVNLRF